MTVYAFSGQRSKERRSYTHVRQGANVFALDKRSNPYKVTKKTDPKKSDLR